MGKEMLNRCSVRTTLRSLGGHPRGHRGLGTSCRPVVTQFLFRDPLAPPAKQTRALWRRGRPCLGRAGEEASLSWNQSIFQQRDSDPRFRPGQETKSTSFCPINSGSGPGRNVFQSRKPLSLGLRFTGLEPSDGDGPSGSASAHLRTRVGGRRTAAGVCGSPDSGPTGRSRSMAVKPSDSQAPKAPNSGAGAAGP